jgi:hypothetical protein
MACVTNAIAISPHDHAHERAASTIVSSVFVNPMYLPLSYTNGGRGQAMLLPAILGRSPLIC